MAGRECGDRLVERRAVTLVGRDQAADEPRPRHGIGILRRPAERVLRGGGGAAEIAVAIGRRRLHQEELGGNLDAPPLELAARIVHRGEGRLGIARLHLREGEVVGDIGDGAASSRS